VTAELSKGDAVGSGRGAKDIYAGGHCGLTGLHKFTKLTAQTVAAYSRPVAAP